MAGALERFLQQAAERLAEKVNEGQQQRGPAPRPRAKPIRQAERSLREPEIVDAEVIEPRTANRLSQRALGPNPLSSIDTRPALAQEIGQADEKMAGHLKHVLDHDVVSLRDRSDVFENAQPIEMGNATQTQHRKRQVSPLIDSLRHPETLRKAFICSEIFRRKF